MSPALVPLLLTIAGGAVYHLSQKAVGGARPWSVLAVAYGVAFVASSLLWWLMPGRGQAIRPAELGLAALIGLAALAIEAGFFLSYRSGWPVGTTALLSNVAVTVVLAAVGVAAYGEALSPTRAVGALLAVLGAWLLARG